VGRPTVFPRRNYEQLRTFGLPRKLDKEVSYLELPGLKSFSSKLQLASSGAPASVIRQQTVELVRTLNSAKAGSSKDARFMISKLGLGLHDAALMLG